MSKPGIKKITDDTFLDGSNVWENDARISAEIQGNIELSDISQTHHVYTIGPIGPFWYAPPDGASGTQARALLIFKAPRAFYVRSLQVFVNQDFAGTSVNDLPLQVISEAANIIVRADRRPYDFNVDNVPGAPDSVHGANALTSDAVPDWANLLAVTGELVSDFDYAQATDAGTPGFGLVKQGDWFRLLMTTNDAAAQPRAVISVSLTVAEEHDE